MHAFDARRAFLLNISQGESALSVAEAALQIAAEDDAIVSHSTVRLPIQASAALPMLSMLLVLYLHTEVAGGRYGKYMGLCVPVSKLRGAASFGQQPFLARIEALVSDLERRILRLLPPDDTPPEAVLEVLLACPSPGTTRSSRSAIFRALSTKTCCACLAPRLLLAGNRGQAVPAYSPVWPNPPSKLRAPPHQAVSGYLFGEARFMLPHGGRSGLPAGAHLDHPGVWEDARLGTPTRMQTDCQPAWPAHANPCLWVMSLMLHLMAALQPPRLRYVHGSAWLLLHACDLPSIGSAPSISSKALNRC